MIRKFVDPEKIVLDTQYWLPTSTGTDSTDNFCYYFSTVGII